MFFEIVKGCYGLPQSGKLSNDILCTRLNKEGYYETTTTAGLWKHRWRPIMFVLIVDDFVMEYVGDEHVQHLQRVLEKHSTITTDWKGEKFAGIDLK